MPPIRPDNVVSRPFFTGVNATGSGVWSAPDTSTTDEIVYRYDPNDDHHYPTIDAASDGAFAGILDIAGSLSDISRKAMLGIIAGSALGSPAGIFLGAGIVPLMARNGRHKSVPLKVDGEDRKGETAAVTYGTRSLRVPVESEVVWSPRELNRFGLIGAASPSIIYRRRVVFSEDMDGPQVLRELRSMFYPFFGGIARSFPMLPALGEDIPMGVGVEYQIEFRSRENTIGWEVTALKVIKDGKLSITARMSGDRKSVVYRFFSYDGRPRTRELPANPERIQIERPSVPKHRKEGAARRLTTEDIRQAVLDIRAFTFDEDGWEKRLAAILGRLKGLEHHPAFRRLDLALHTYRVESFSMNGSGRIGGLGHLLEDVRNAYSWLLNDREFREFEARIFAGRQDTGLFRTAQTASTSRTGPAMNIEPENKPGPAPEPAIGHGSVAGKGPAIPMAVPRARKTVAEKTVPSHRDRNRGTDPAVSVPESRDGTIVDISRLNGVFRPGSLKAASYELTSALPVEWKVQSIMSLIGGAVEDHVLGRKSVDSGNQLQVLRTLVSTLVKVLKSLGGLPIIDRNDTRLAEDLLSRVVIGLRADNGRLKQENVIIYDIVKDVVVKWIRDNGYISYLDIERVLTYDQMKSVLSLASNFGIEELDQMSLKISNDPRTRLFILSEALLNVNRYPTRSAWKSDYFRSMEARFMLAREQAGRYGRMLGTVTADTEKVAIEAIASLMEGPTVQFITPDGIAHAVGRKMFALADREKLTLAGLKEYLKEYFGRRGEIDVDAEFADIPGVSEEWVRKVLLEVINSSDSYKAWGNVRHFLERKKQALRRAVNITTGLAPSVLGDVSVAEGYIMERVSYYMAVNIGWHGIFKESDAVRVLVSMRGSSGALVGPVSAPEITERSEH